MQTGAVAPPPRPTQEAALLPPPPLAPSAEPPPLPPDLDPAAIEAFHAHHDESDEDDDEEGDTIPAGLSADTPTAPAATKAKRLPYTDEEIRQRAKTDPASLGSMSIGKPNQGRLVNGVQMPKSERWVLVDPDKAWATQESVDSLTRAIGKVHDAHANTPKAYIGHWSAKHGGHLRPHKSHQSGRDVDISFYLHTGARWYEAATESKLDKARTWTFVKALAQSGDVEWIFIDTSVQKWLRAYAASQGEDAKFLDKVFQYGSKEQRTLVRHVKGHATHLHIRFWSPEATRVGALASGTFPPPSPPAPEKPATDGKDPKGKDPKGQDPKGQDPKGKGKDPKGQDPKGKGKDPKAKEPAYVSHTVRSGELLTRIAARYGTTVDAIRQANGLKNDKIKPKQVLKIPKA